MTSLSFPLSLPPSANVANYKFFIIGEFDDLLDGNVPSLSSQSQHNNIDGINIIFKSSDPSVRSSNGSLTQSDPHMVLEIRNLTLLTPRSGNVLIIGLTMELKDKDHLLVFHFSSYLHIRQNKR